MVMQLESLANRACLLQCGEMALVGDEQCNLDAVKFTFILWDHVAYRVRMGCVLDGSGSMLFVVSYDSPANGKRLFMGAPWRVSSAGVREPASVDAVDNFLQKLGGSGSAQADVVFDGDLAADRPVSLHLRFDGCMDCGAALLVKDVAQCDNVLLVIDMF